MCKSWCNCNNYAGCLECNYKLLLGFVLTRLELFQIYLQLFRHPKYTLHFFKKIISSILNVKKNPRSQPKYQTNVKKASQINVEYLKPCRMGPHCFASQKDSVSLNRYLPIQYLLHLWERESVVTLIWQYTLIFN